MRIQLLVTCLVDSLYPEVGERTVSLLERLGCDVHFPKNQTCCGQPAFNSGYPRQARRLAEHTVRSFDPADGPVVAPFGSCIHMLKAHYPTLLADSALYGRCIALGQQAYDLASFIVDRLGHNEVGGRYPGPDGTKVAYHHECHMLRGLGVRSQPLSLLTGVEGCKLLSTGDEESCCGFGGTFSIKQSQTATAIADSKLDRAIAVGAEAIVSTDVGCLMHLAGRAHRRGLNLPIHHLVDLLEPYGTITER